jgi:hypothetical protein
MLASCVTPAGPPAVVTSVKVHTKSTTMTITWKEPSNNGSPITGYYIDIGEKELIFVSSELNEYTIDEVLPDTTYRFVVRSKAGLYHMSIVRSEFVYALSIRSGRVHSPPR